MSNNQYSEFNRRKNTMDDNTTPNTNTPEVQNAKLSGDTRTFLIAFLTAVIVVIAYHLTQETIKFFNDDSDFYCTRGQMQKPVVYSHDSHGHHFRDGDRPLMKKRKFRHFRDCEYFGASEADKFSAKDCKCSERIKKFREHRKRMMKHHGEKRNYPVENLPEMKKTAPAEK